MPVTEAQVEVALATWQPVMRLADWDVKVVLVTRAWRKSGDIKVDLDDRKAVLLVAAATEPGDLEETVVHELVHLQLYGLDRMLSDLLDSVYGNAPDEPRRQFAEARFMAELESTTEDLAKALLRAHNPNATFSFERLRAEVDREVGG